MPNLTPEDIDAILPQTQCGLCGYGGCMPYAEALVYEQAAINLCPPGGMDTLNQLGTILNVDPTPYQPDMQAKTKARTLAVIREQECIGCTKCIKACPVDAIIGSGKLMHVVIAADCTGCDLCVPACPVDCIDIITHPNPIATEEEKDAARIHFNRRNERMRKEKQASLQKASIAARQAYIAEALARKKDKTLAVKQEIHATESKQNSG